MLKINKILSKKIKSPLSLRGLFPFCHSRFPFCHSRESGNPSPPVIAREQSNRRNLNLSGFSLIELMVAVAILAMAIFGIFQAYTVGFMSINDAKERTIATNYMQETMEEIVGLPFETIGDNLAITGEPIISNPKFKKTIYLEYNIEDSPQLKKVNVMIEWGESKHVHGSTVVYDSQAPSESSEIGYVILIANPYYILPNDESTLTAIIKDKNGNTMTSWSEGTFNFKISNSQDLDGNTIGDTLGNLVPSAKTPVNGSANITFNSSGDVEGLATIEVTLSTDQGDFKDNVILHITYAGVYINLTADKQVLDADGIDTAILTASVVDAGGNVVIDPTTKITFTITEGYGTLSSPTTKTTSEEDGTTSIEVTSSSTPGKIKVTATALSLIADYVYIISTSDEPIPVQIEMIADPPNIYNNDSSQITVQILDQFENPIAYNGTIDFIQDIEIGSIDSVTFDGTGNSMTTQFIPISGYSGTVTITAQSQAEDVFTDSVVITVSNQPVAIFLSSEGVLYADSGNSTITIKAEIVDAGSNLVSSYNGEVTFYIAEGFGLFSDNSSNSIVTAINGIAEISLKSTSDVPGDVKIQANANGLTGDLITVTAYGVPYEVRVSPDSNIDVGDDSELTVGIYDSVDNPVPFEGLVELNMSPTGLGILDETTLYFKGETTQTTNFHATNPGTVVITPTASYNNQALGLTTATIIIEEVVISINLVEDSINAGSQYFNFDISVSGSSLIVEEMIVSWEGYANNQKLTQIIINGNLVFTGAERKSGETSDIIDTTLGKGDSTVELLFNTHVNIVDNSFDVSFVCSNGETYTINEILP
ncbi:MAG: hypothetical protein DRP89_06470 [Candidatus Neomarinimicrobiota bacterium]|nr:MAG: hypothetical protein DRP89_06470 [Candidatus Neomarinimicrobiota bacterium]